MSFFRCFTISYILTSLHLSCSTLAATIEVHNNCSYTVWPAAVPGGGLQLDSGSILNLTVEASSGPGRIWGRTGCQFEGVWRGSCETGDCRGLLQCETSGTSPHTLAEFTLNQFQNMDFLDISLVNGFNIPMEFIPTSSNCTIKPIRCSADINRLCPTELRHPGGCHHPCSVFKNDQFCCTGSAATPQRCGPTTYSKLFKDACPDAYSYPYDDATSAFSCPAGSYKLVFCP